MPSTCCTWRVQSEAMHAELAALERHAGAEQISFSALHERVSHALEEATRRIDETARRCTAAERRAETTERRLAEVDKAFRKNFEWRIDALESAAGATSAEVPPMRLTQCEARVEELERQIGEMRHSAAHEDKRSTERLRRVDELVRSVSAEVMPTPQTTPTCGPAKIGQ
jgi:DNA repair ATPase RecN